MTDAPPITRVKVALMRDVLGCIKAHTSESLYAYTPDVLAALEELSRKHGIPIKPDERSKAQRKRRATEEVSL